MGNIVIRREFHCPYSVHHLSPVADLYGIRLLDPCTTTTTSRQKMEGQTSSIIEFWRPIVTMLLKYRHTST